VKHRKVRAKPARSTRNSDHAWLTMCRQVRCHNQFCCPLRGGPKGSQYMVSGPQLPRGHGGHVPQGELYVNAWRWKRNAAVSSTRPEASCQGTCTHGLMTPIALVCTSHHKPPSLASLQPGSALLASIHLVLKFGLRISSLTHSSGTTTTIHASLSWMFDRMWKVCHCRHTCQQRKARR